MAYGALKYLSSENLLRSLRLVKKGKVYQLGRVLDMNSPAHPFHGPFFYTTFRRVKDSRKIWKGNFGAMNVRIEFTDHAGTHIDALNHVTIDDLFYEGKRVDEIESERGTTELGSENFRPIVTRGVLLDVAEYMGLEMLSDDHAISVKDITDTIKTAGIGEPGVGDAVLVRTGWGRLWAVDNRRYLGPPMPGISLEVAKWLAERGVIVVGSDTASVERIKVEKPDEPHIEPVHQYLLVEKGIFILENLELESIAADKAYEFLFVCNPVRIRGATAGIVNPIAIS